ncbi:hypothetical protein DFH09DRAFT_1463082 [Mycena vulgaris]|nr:hypothetical protein DFH09DRAFT_1463082 [Mycena vulgaris]
MGILMFCGTQSREVKKLPNFGEQSENPVRVWLCIPRLDPHSLSSVSCKNHARLSRACAAYEAFSSGHRTHTAALFLTQVRVVKVFMSWTSEPTEHLVLKPPSQETKRERELSAGAPPHLVSSSSRARDNGDLKATTGAIPQHPPAASHSTLSTTCINTRRGLRCPPRVSAWRVLHPIPVLPSTSRSLMPTALISFAESSSIARAARAPDSPSTARLLHVPGHALLDGHAQATPMLHPTGGAGGHRGLGRIGALCGAYQPAVRTSRSRQPPIRAIKIAHAHRDDALTKSLRTGDEAPAKASPCPRRRRAEDLRATPASSRVLARAGRTRAPAQSLYTPSTAEARSQRTGPPRVRPPSDAADLEHPSAGWPEFRCAAFCPGGVQGGEQAGLDAGPQTAGARKTVTRPCAASFRAPLADQQCMLLPGIPARTREKDHQAYKQTKPLLRAQERTASERTSPRARLAPKANELPARYLLSLPNLLPRQRRLQAQENGTPLPSSSHPKWKRLPRSLFLFLRSQRYGRRR